MYGVDSFDTERRTLSYSTKLDEYLQFAPFSAEARESSTHVVGARSRGRVSDGVPACLSINISTHISEFIIFLTFFFSVSFLLLLLQMP